MSKAMDVDGSASADSIRVNIDQPRTDQKTYWGRASHFFVTTNPLNLFATPDALDKSRDIVTRYRKVSQFALCLAHFDVRYMIVMIAG